MNATRKERLGPALARTLIPFVVAAALIGTTGTAAAEPLGVGDDATVAVAVEAVKKPRKKAKVAFDLGVGGRVKVVKLKGSWAKIESDTKAGWVPLSALARVEPPAVDPSPAAVANRPPAATPPPAPPSLASPEVARSAGPAGTESALATPATSPASGSSAAAVGPGSAPEPESPDLGVSASPWEETNKIKTIVSQIRTSGLDAGITQSISGVVANELDGMGVFEVIGMQEIKNILDLESQRQMLGCEESSCAAEIGGALGAELFVTGSVNKLGELFVLNLQVTRVASSEVEGRVSREIAGDVSKLTEETRIATRILMSKVLAEHSGQLLVRAEEQGATVRLDEKIIGSTPMPMVEAPGGTHLVEVEKEGFISWRREVQIRENDTNLVQVLLIPSNEHIRSYESRANTFRALGWTGTVAGGALIAGGLAAYLIGMSEAGGRDQNISAYTAGSDTLTLEERQTLWSDINEQNETVALLDTLSLVGLATGAALTGAGIYFLVTGEDPDRYREFSGEVTTEAGVQGQLMVGPGSLLFSGRW